MAACEGTVPSRVFAGTAGNGVFESAEGGLMWAASNDGLGLASDIVRHVFTGSAQDGTVLPAGVPLFHEHAFRLDGSLNEPKLLTEPTVAKS